ncbi:MAG: cytochrome c oxidase assembly protein [Actinobacteria bacterium]|nr:cytochrome c oxidase assembly protein [Actinomycetota bacterium]
MIAQLEVPDWVPDVPPDLAGYLTIAPAAPLLLPATAILLAVVYLAGAVRLWSQKRRWSIGRTLLFLCGCLLIFAVTGTNVEGYGYGMFSVFMFQQLTLMMIVPVFLVLGAPGTLLLRATPHRFGGQLVLRAAHWGLRSRLGKLLIHPGFALPLFLISFYGLYLGAIADAFLATQFGHTTLEVLFLVSGVLFTVPVLSVDPLPRRQNHAGRLLDVFGEMALHAFFGVIVMMAATPLVAAFANPPASWNVDPIADQQLAGALAWSYGEFPNLIIVLILLHAWYLSDTKRSRIADERADKEGTPELDSYNAYLESLTRAADRNPTRKEPS